jgi:hypothetical protein
VVQVKDGAGAYGSTDNGVDTTPGNTISIKLFDTLDVTTWYLEVIGTDELSSAPTLVGVNVLTHEVASPATVVTFSNQISLGRALLFRSTVVGPLGSVATTFALFNLTAGLRRVGPTGMTREGDLTYGWTSIVNPLIRNPAALPPGTSTSDVLTWDGGAYNPRRLTEDDILPGFLVTSFAGGTSIELGATVTTPAMTASYSSAPDVTANSVVLTDTEATPSKDVTLTPTAFTSDGTYTKAVYGQSVTLTLTANKGAVTKVATSTFTWIQNVYWGKSSSAGPYNAAFITGLAHNALASSRATTLNMAGGDAPGVGEKIYYAFRSAYGTPTFYIGGFEGGFELIAAAVAVTNGHGVTENYDLWRSVQANLGDPTIVTVT